MPKTFKQFQQELNEVRLGGGKTISPSKGKPTVAGHDIDKLRVPTRLGSGKNIEKSKNPTFKNKALNKPWIKKKPEVKKPEKKGPSGMEKFNKKMDAAADVTRGAFHAGMEKPKQVAHGLGKVAGTTAKIGLGATKIAVKGVARIHKAIKKQSTDAASRQSKVPVIH